ncbi:ATP-binding protein [Halpernia sp.]|uniref:ATP-binding protein n=1 Tax=Halpernia sp. TaxID=2782209 RepID=UPI003A8CA8E6
MNLEPSIISEECKILLENSPFGICLLGSDFKIINANKIWLNTLSLRKENILGKRLSEVLPQIKKNLPALLTEVLNSDIAFHTQEIPLTVEKNGAIYQGTFDFLYYPVHGKNDELEYFTCIAIENTNVKNLRNQLAKSDERLRLATEINEIGIWELDFESNKIEHSNSLPLVFGYEKNRIMTYEEMKSHLISTDSASVEQALLDSTKNGIYDYVGRIIDIHGNIKWINSRGRVFFKRDGKPERIVGVLQDISEKQSYQQEIKDRDSQFRFLADAMAQFIWLGDKDGKLYYFNKSVFDYSGKTYLDFLHNNGWLEIVHPEDREKNIELWTTSVKNKTIFTFEHRFRDKNGDYRWMLSRAVPDFDENGDVKVWIGTSTDIHDIKKQEYQKNDFIKMANHELKTPVTTIKGYIQLLKKMRGNSDDQFLNISLNTIENQVNKLNNLIGDLLDISRMENGILPLVKKSFSLLKLVTETIEDIKASEDSHEIKFTLSADKDVEVIADKERITQVLNNLLTNAIKYSPNAKIVNVELNLEENQAVVSVEDYGIGMDQKELQKIFERFYRVSGEDEETFPGFGIGLFIVKDILNRHSGDIWVESEKHKGSKFYFSLPLKQI